MHLAYNIRYDDKVITTVSDTKVYYAAVNMVADMVESKNVEEVLPQPQIDTIVTLNEDFDTCAEVAGAIIDNTDEIVSASKLIVNGEVVACTDTSLLSLALEARRTEYDLEGEICTSEFCDDVSTEEGLFLSSEVSGIKDVKSLIWELDVKTVAKVYDRREVDYDTVLEENPEKQVGYKSIRQNGEKGIEVTTTGEVYINGKKTEETVSSVETVKEPVNEIITVGTKAPKNSTVKFKSGFSFPLPSGVWELSCPYGKGGHKGVDLRAPRGTPIKAAASGKVIEASYKGSYGNCVVIDHGNGITTFYAHASAFCVSAGEYVAAGETIALVGSTGNSTGNHLHFEIHIGNNRINPQPYIGL